MGQEQQFWNTDRGPYDQQTENSFRINGTDDWSSPVITGLSTNVYTNKKDGFRS